jgi:2-methylisocitrate lyase-like PEP mutase family enzyme
MIPDRTRQQRLAASFLEMHSGPKILILPNAWDCVSARIFELEGFRAIGTTSAGISASLGFPDGEKMPVGDMLEVTRRIVSRVSLPVSADIEAGYADTIEGVVATVKSAMETGIVGINLEDSTGRADRPLYDLDHQVEKIAAVREMANNQGIHLVINARTDAYMLSKAGTTGRLKAAIERANLYRQAGADCIFVPDLEDLTRKDIQALTGEIDAAVNIIAGANTPPIEELLSLGVARVSLGPRPMRAALATLRRIAAELREKGVYDSMTADALTYSEVNRMFEAEPTVD